MEKRTQKIAGVACLTLAFLIASVDFFLSPSTAPKFAGLHTEPVSIALSSDTAQHLAQINPAVTLFTPTPPPQSFEIALNQDTSPPPAPSLKNETFQISRGETLAALLTGAGVNKEEVHKAMLALGPIYNPKGLKAGQDIIITCRQDANGTHKELIELSFQPDIEKDISVVLTQNGKFKAKSQKTVFKKELKKIDVTIQSSLLGSATAKGIPSHMMTPLIQAFSYDIDFQRDIKKGDLFTLVFEQFHDPKTGRNRHGNVLFAELTPKGKHPVRLYRFAPNNGKVQFYNERGENIKKALMRTPINGARISSHFGHRRHPIKGYTKMHKGVDFSAPQGTPVMAAGDGKIVKACRSGGLGNLVKIAHNKEYATGYAHLSKFAKGIKPGKFVTQGTIIGYVGRTGHTTGAHLHFEVYKNNVHVNPTRVANISSGKLDGKVLKLFLSAKKTIDRKISGLLKESHLALNNDFGMEELPKKSISSHKKKPSFSKKKKKKKRVRL